MLSGAQEGWKGKPSAIVRSKERGGKTIRILALDDARQSKQSLLEAVRLGSPDAAVYDFSEPEPMLEFARVNPCEAVFVRLPMRQGDGMAIARRLKRLQPRINLIFVADSGTYAAEALELHASGYLLTPLTPEKIAAELADLRYCGAPEKDVRLRIRCLGNFDVCLADGTPLYFSRSKSKEAFAYLVHRRGSACTIREIAAILFEDKPHDLRQQRYIQKIISCMMQTLRAAGAESVIQKRYNSIALDVSRVDCDSYNFSRLDHETASAYHSEYMLPYSWAETIPSYYLWMK